MIIDTEDQPANPSTPEKEEPSHEKQETGLTNFSSTSALEQESHQGYHSSGYGWGRGIIADFKRTVGTHWKQEMVNFNQKTIAVSFFLFFACIAPAITFGAIYAKATNNWIGAVEMILATAWCGILYALLGGQPMMINGGTGPVLAFTEILFKMSETLDVPFLTFNAWIGIWVCIYMCIAAFTDLNRIIVYATRFTDEIFSLLIAAIFIINAIGNPFAPIGIVYYFDPEHKSHDEYEADPDYSYMATALLSLLICIGTVQLAFALRKAKFSPFLPSQIARNVVTDFAVVMSIVVMTLIANVLFREVETETLNVPDSFAPTYACCTETCETNWPDDCPDLSEPARRRSWFVDLGDLNGKGFVPIMAAGPALLAFILVFLDDGITWHLINHPTHKLKHGDAYDYDTLIIGLMIFVDSLLGLPWLVAATVRSLNHVHAMAEKSSDGKIISVQETRLTHLGIHLLCLASIFALEVLKLIPMPVLYGVFLFMGLVSLGTNQFWGRILMFFMQPSKYPLEPYTQHMSPRRMHLFTGIQLGLFILLYVVKAVKTIAIAFPIIIACCIPIRLLLLPKIFTEEELILIDSDDEAVKALLSGKAAAAAGELDDEEMKKSVSDESEEEDNNEDLDQLGPLPGEKGTDSVDKERQRRRKNRKKSISCPTNMLFSEAALSAASNLDGSVTEEESNFSDEGSSPLTSAAAARSRRRQKSLSCPPHMLFAEAERQIASNYFFG